MFYQGEEDFSELSEELSLEEIEEELERLEAEKIVPEEVEKIEVKEKVKAGGFVIYSFIVGYFIMLAYMFILPFILKALALKAPYELGDIPGIFKYCVIIVHDPLMSVISGSYNTQSLIFAFLCLLPYILGGIIAGAITREKGYGFVSGVMVWIFAIILAIIVPIAFGAKGDIVSMVWDYIIKGWISALFLAIFGSIGGAIR